MQTSNCGYFRKNSLIRIILPYFIFLLKAEQIWLLYINKCVCVCLVASVESDSLPPYGLLATRPLCPWDSPGENTRVGCHALLQGIFPTQGLNPCLLPFLHCRWDSLPLSNPGSPKISIILDNLNLDLTPEYQLLISTY